MVFENPSAVAKAVALAGDHRAGMLLYRIHYFMRYAKATIPETEGTWIANDRNWWARDVRLTLTQLDRALSRLEQRGMIERRQWFWDNRKILFVRLTAAASDVFKDDLTWEKLESVWFVEWASNENWHDVEN